MNGLALEQDSPNHRPGISQLEWLALHALCDLGRKAVVRDVMIEAAPCNSDDGSICATESRRGLDQRVEHCLQIEGRTADDLEHVGGSGLLRERFTQLAEQPGVLDGDDCLGCEVLDQCDLLVTERADFPPIDCHHANRLVVLKHRHSDHCADACDVYPGNGKWGTTQISRGSTQVANLDGLS